MYGLKKRSKKDGSGLIQGAGTGTSDEIKKSVPSGSYIMPADSTAQIGEQNLQRLGKPTPVNLSNGEFQLSPDQVHSVGVQALTQIKDQTHVPVDQPQVQHGEQGEPELFFANGGLIQSAYPNADDVRRAQQARLGHNMKDVSGVTRDVNRSLPATNVNPTAQPSTSPMNPTQPSGGNFGARMMGKVGNATKGLGVMHGIGSMAGGAVQGFNTSTEDYATRMGLDPNAERGELANLGIRAAGVMSDVGNAASLGILGKRFPDKQVQQAQSDYDAQQARFAEWNKSKDSQVSNQPKPASIAQPVKASTEQQVNDAMWSNEEPKQTTPNPVKNTNPYAIQQKGNSFNYADPQAAQQARTTGVPELQAEGVAGGIRRANDPRGVANLMQNTREMGPSEQQIQQALNNMQGGQGFGLRYPERPMRDDSQHAERSQLISDIRAPIKGARGMTSNQRAQLLELQTGDDNRATQMYNTDANNSTSQFNNTANNATALQREAMGQDGQNYRSELGENGQTFRQGQALNQDSAKFNADFGLKNRQQSLTEKKEGFGIRQAGRIEKLQEMYDRAENKEQRQSILDRINRYSGEKNSEDVNPYINIRRGEVLDEKGNMIQPAGEVLFNRKTGQTIDPLAQIQVSQPSENHISALKNNPKQATQFDAIYGKGAATQYIK